MICHLLCSSKGMLLTGFCPSSRHKPLVTQPSGMIMKGHLSCGYRPVGSRSWMISLALSLNCKLQSLSFALAGGSRIDILGPPG